MVDAPGDRLVGDRVNVAATLKRRMSIRWRPGELVRAA
jgi:hypothetical protein